MREAVAGLNLPYEVQLATDAAEGKVSWKLRGAELPQGLALDSSSGAIRGRPPEPVVDRTVAVEAKDSAGKFQAEPL